MVFVHADQQGSIWTIVATADRSNRIVETFLDRLDPSTGRFTRYGRRPNGPSRSGPERISNRGHLFHAAPGFAFFEGSDGTIWVGSPDAGLYVYDREADELFPIPVRDRGV